MNALFENKNFLAVEDYEDFIVIFHFRPDMGIYRGVRIKKDKLGEVINALSQVPTGEFFSITVVDASPSSSKAHYNADIVVKRIGFFTFIERGDFIPWVCFPCNLVPALIELLKGNVPSEAFDVENQIIHIPEIQGKRYPRWTNVLNLDTIIVILDIDRDDIVGGTTIPLVNVDLLIKDLQTVPRDAVEITLSNPTDMLMLDATVIGPLVNELKRIKFSQQP